MTTTAERTTETALSHYDERRLAVQIAERLGNVYPERRVLLINGRWWTDGNCMIRLFDEPLPAYSAKEPPVWEWEASTFNADTSAARFAASRQTPCVAPVWNARSEWLSPDGVHGVEVTDGERRVNFNHRYVSAIRDLVTPDRWTLADALEDPNNPHALPFLCAWRGDELVGAVMPFVTPEWLRDQESA